MRGSRRAPLRKTKKNNERTSSKKKLSNKYLSKVLNIKNNIITSWENFFAHGSQISDNWDSLEEILQPLRQKYAWAVPDPRALNILKEFSPLIEIGAGNGYWARLLSDRGVNIIAYDVRRSPNCWTDVQVGGPEMLLSESITTACRNLFLCYPDEDESIAIRCLENFSGEYIIHVGEIMTSGTLGGVPQAPFGRTSSAEFQISLTCSFHCILIANLQCSPPYGIDTISVWKRTRYVPVMRNAISDISCDINSNTIKNIMKEDKRNISDCKTRNIHKKKSKGISLDTSSEGAFEGFINLNSLSDQNRNMTSSTSTQAIQSNDMNSLTSFARVNSKNKKNSNLPIQTIPVKISRLSIRNRSEDDDYLLRRKREEELDIQYKEDDSKLWADIPFEERLPVDRAAPCLQHLLE